VTDGSRMDRRHRGHVGRDDRNRARAVQARRTQGRTHVIGLDVLYGFAGLVAVILFAYLVFALICAEEF
jgi:K+-transporting ATPase KdpF subunit